MEPDAKKNQPVATEHASVDDQRDAIGIADRLLTELNLLKLEGFLFCFDPKEAARRSGTRELEQIERFQDIVKRPVAITISAEFGQPSVIAYKVLQAVFRKATEEGWPIPEVVSFSQRELAALTGRSSWGGADGKQFYRAIMQLQSSLIRCSWYDKATTNWETAAFNVFSTTRFSGRGERLTACSVQLHPLINKSLNDNHFSCVNWNRMRDLEPIGMALYKRLSFHFANLLGKMSREKREKLLYSKHTELGRELAYSKDYKVLLAEWLGGLKPEEYKSKIIGNQLGRHIEGLRKAGLIQRYEIERKANGEDWKITFYAGRGLFADYEAFYVRQLQPQLRFRQSTDRRNIEQPLELVALFHQHLGHTQNTFDPRETLYASQLLDQYPFEELKGFIGFTVEAMKQTGFDKTARLFTVARLYEAPWRQETATLAKSRTRRKRIEECLLCDARGMLFVRHSDGTRSATKCQHDPVWLKTFLQANGLEKEQS